MKKQIGLSLVELMIAVVLGLILVAGVIQVFLGSKQTYFNQQAVSRAQETGRLAVEFMSKDLRLASGTGFRGRATPITNTIPSPDVYRNYVQGFSLVSAATGITKLAGTDIFIVRGVMSGVSSSLVKAGENKKLTVEYLSTEASCTGATDGYNSLCQNQDLVVSDYKKAIVFKPTKLVVNGTVDVAIEYAEDWGGNEMQINQHFVVGAQVSRISSVAYFIATGTNGRPSLFQRSEQGAIAELLSGVRNFRVSFSNASAPTTFTTMVAGGAAPNWNNMSNPVITVRIEVLVESPDEVLEDPQTYTFAGAAVTAADRRIYQVYSTSITLRNRLP